MKNNNGLRWSGVKGSVFSILAIVALVGGFFVATNHALAIVVPIVTNVTSPHLDGAFTVG